MGDPTMLGQINHLPCRKNLRTAGQLLRAAVIATCLSGALVACTSGGGGDNGNGNKGEGPGVSNPGKSGGLIFSYPVDGQTDVYSGSQIAFAFAGDASGKVKLVDADGHTVATKLVNQGNGIFNLRVVDSDAALTSNTRYAVKADGKIGSGNTRFKNGQTLFSFTTAPAPGAASKKGFQIVSHRGDKNDRYPFTQFNPIRAKFSESVDEGTVKLCTGNEALGDDNCTVAITGPNGNVPGRLTVLGRDFVFDPGSGHVPIVSDDASDYVDQDLAANTQYTVAFSKQVHSAFGESLPSGQRSFSVTPVSIGKDVIQRLSIGDAGSGSNPLNGRARNNVELASQLIGSYGLTASQLPNRGGLKVRLAAPGKPAYKNTFPTSLPRGQAFQLSSLKLKLGSQLNSDGTYSKGQVDTPVNLDHLTAQFANDVDAFITANSLRNIEKPTRVQLRLDLNISGKMPQGSPIAALSNGVVNQTALNIVASGIAVPQANGDVSLVTLGSFPIKVNRDGVATTNFELELTLPASADDQPDVRGDQTAPFITAEYPSACSYTFGSEGFIFGNALADINGSTTLSTTEAACIHALTKRQFVSNNDQATVDDLFDTQPMVSSFPLNANPSITFSESIDPTSLAGNITLTNVATGNSVAVNFRSEGSSVVIAPAEPLKPDTQYTVDVSNGVTDLAGNGLTGNFPGSTIVSNIMFQTEPMVVPTNSDGSYVDISQDLTQREIVRQNAPYLAALTPGLACALMASGDDSESNFRSGGDVAGRCIGNVPLVLNTIRASSAAAPGTIPDDLAAVTDPPITNSLIEYPVFRQPGNVPVRAYFSKPVQASTISLSDGCLIGGSDNTNDAATVAIQKMDASGNCQGAVSGDLTLLNVKNGLTDGFMFRPIEPFSADQSARYWIVICGSQDVENNVGGSSCSTSQTIRGQSGLRLNTTPLLGVGTQIAPGNNADGARNRGDNRGQGGPDIVMPFMATAPTADYYSETRVLPETDTNGNGFFDNQPAPQTATGVASTVNAITAGTNTGPNTSDLGAFDDSLGREIVQAANSVTVRDTEAVDRLLNFGFRPEVGFLSGVRPIAIRQQVTGSECRTGTALTLESGESVIGGRAPSTCIPVDLLPGGLLQITNLNGNGLVPTGAILVSFPYKTDAEGNAISPQRGYIVPKCEGTLPGGNSYDYEPCFVGDLSVKIVGNDGANTQGFELNIPQQDVDLQVFGPVGFEQDGSLVISTINARQFGIVVNLVFGSTPIYFGSAVNAGQQHLQLIGQAIHGGEAFPTR